MPALQLQNLESYVPSPTDSTATEELNLENMELGTTEYVLIGLWALFTTGVFGLLYKITKEADHELETKWGQVKGEEKS